MLYGPSSERFVTGDPGEPKARGTGMKPESAPDIAMPEPPPGRGALVRRVAIGLIVLAIFFLLARVVGGQLPALASWVESLGAWGPLVFITLYILAIVLFVPGSILTLAGGALFGVLLGTVYVFVAAVLGSCLAFLIARYGGRQFVERRLGQNPRFDAVARAIAQNGLKITFLLRLSPAFPFTLMNYALGLTRVRFPDYILASFGMLPATVLYVYSGRVIGDVAALAGGAPPQQGAGQYVLLAVGLIATLAVAIIVTRIARRALAELTESETPPHPGEEA